MMSETNHSQEGAKSRRTFLGLGAAVAVLGFNRLAYAQDTAAVFTQLGNVTVREGMEEQALEIFREIAETHRANSPAVLVYLVHRARNDPRRLVTFEVFQDEASAKATAGAPAMFPFYRKLQDVGLNTENVPLDRVVGFLR